MPWRSQHGARYLAALLLCAAGSVNGQTVILQDVRAWSQNGITRVAVQLSGSVETRQDRLYNPERHFFDFHGTSPAKRGIWTIAVGDALVKQIRIAEAKPGVTRLVLDLSANVEVSLSELANPYRLMIEVKRAGSSPALAAEAPVVISSAPSPPPAQVAVSHPAELSRNVKSFQPPPVNLVRVPDVQLPSPPVVSEATRRRFLPQVQSTTRWPKYAVPAKVQASVRLQPVTPAPPPPETVRRAVASIPADPIAAPPAQPARRTANGGSSMTRALGLKIRRVVLDPGHGGYDQGSSGPTGLLEKELVLDVAQRLGELIQLELGSEVIYTRTGDQFIPLEARTRIANDSKADLFLSIHANSSTIRSVSGVETYFLSFTTSKEALEVAGRENATSERSVFELRDLLQKIALQEKVEESREFANKVNSSLFRLWGQAGATRNRGVKKAPFIVLIGASMPSVLAEIGFLSNPKDEKEMKKPEVRQKIAEALMKGISQYAGSLSHFAVARRSSETNE